MPVDISAPVARAPRWRRAALRLVGPAILLVLIAFVIDPSALAASIRRSDPWLFAGGVLLIQVGIALRGGRWMGLHYLCGLDPVGVGYQLRLSFAAGFAAQLLPPPASPFSRLVLLAQDGHPPGRALAALVLEKIADVLMILLFGLFGAAYLSAILPSAARVAATAALFTVVGAGAWLARQRLSAIVHQVLGRIRTRIGATTLAELDITLRAASPRRLVALVVLSLVITLIQASATFVMARAVGIPASYPFLIAVWGLVALTLLIPFSINGIGVREGIYVAALATVGVSRDSAFALSLLMLAATFIAATPGAVEWLVRLAFPRLSLARPPLAEASLFTSQSVVDQRPERRSPEQK